MSAPVVSFDLDGVIMRGPFTSEVRPRLWAHLARSPDLVHLEREQADRRSSAAVRAAHRRRLAEGNFVAAWDWDAIYGEVSHAFGGGPAPSVAQLVQESCRVQDGVAVLAGVEHGLARLAQAGVRIVAVTNGYRVYQWPVLETLGLATLFESVVTPEGAGYAKPDPRIFSGVPGLLAHVGDVLEHDVLGANLAGIGSIWLNPELPAPVLACAPEDRPGHADFAAVLEDALARSRSLAYHPEATAISCQPDAVVVDVDEAADVLLRWCAATTTRPE